MAEPKKGWLGSVPDPEKTLPPWDRSNPSYAVGAGKDEKTTTTVTAKLTSRESRDLQKIVQHRKYAVIETKQDGIRVGLMMLRYWYSIHHNDCEMQAQLDVEMWENERVARMRYRDRILKLLDGLRTEMSEAQRLGYENRLKGLRAELGRYRKQLTDEELRGKANQIYVEFSGKDADGED